MTAVFLSGGAGVALAGTSPADGGAPEATNASLLDGTPGLPDDLPGLPADLPGLPDDLSIDVLCDLLDTATGALPDGVGLPAGVSLAELTGSCSADEESAEDEDSGEEEGPDRGEGGRGNGHHGGHHHGEKAGHDKDCGCAKADDGHEAEDCAAAPKESPEKVTEKAPEKGTEKTADIPDSDQVRGASAPVDVATGSTPEVQTVADTSIADDQVSEVPAGAVDAGDGSSMLSFGPVAPVAAQGSTADGLALAGGAAALLLGGYGVRMGRHRRAGAHRS